jgi:hypothetical protein
MPTRTPSRRCLFCAPSSLRILVVLAVTTFASTASAQSLIQLEIIGPSEVLGGETATYSMHATYDNDMYFEVTLCGDLSVDSEEYAQIDRFGRLETVEVDSDKTVTVWASFADGITLEAELEVTIIANSPLQCDFPTYVWSRAMGGLQEDAGHGFATDGSGNVWVVGSFEGRVDFDPGDGVDVHESAGAEDVFVTRLNPNGTYGWTCTFGGRGSDVGLGVAVAADQSVALTGWFEETVDFDPGPGIDLHTSNGGTDAFVVKLDEAGWQVWAHTIGGIQDDAGADIAVDVAGSVVATGHFRHQVDFDPTPGEEFHSSHGDRDIFLLKLGGDGAFGWAHTVGGLQADEGLAVAVGPEGVVWGTGRFRTIVDFDPGADSDTHRAEGGTDVFVTCLASDGSYTGTQTFGGPSTDGGYDISVGPGGEVAVTGYFWDTVDFDPSEQGVDEHTSGGQSDVFVTRLHADGSYRWTHTLGGSLVEEGLGVSVDPSDNTLVTGHFRGTVDFDCVEGGDEHTSAGGEDVFVMRLRPDSSYAWTITMGGQADDVGQSLATDADGRIMLTGSFSDLVDFDPGDGIDNHLSHGGADVFALTLRCTRGTFDDGGPPDFVVPDDVRPHEYRSDASRDRSSAEADPDSISQLLVAALAGCGRLVLCGRRSLAGVLGRHIERGDDRSELRLCTGRCVDDQRARRLIGHEDRV